MPLGLSNSMPIKLAMSVAFSGSADAWVLTPWKNDMQMGCAQTYTRVNMSNVRMNPKLVNTSNVVMNPKWAST